MFRPSTIRLHPDQHLGLSRVAGRSSQDETCELRSVRTRWGDATQTASELAWELFGVLVMFLLVFSVENERSKGLQGISSLR